MMIRQPVSNLLKSSNILKKGSRNFAAAGIEVLDNLAESIMTEDQKSYRDLAKGFSDAELEPYAAGIFV